MGSWHMDWARNAPPRNIDYIVWVIRIDRLQRKMVANRKNSQTMLKTI